MDQMLQSEDTEWQTGLKKKKAYNMPPTGDPLLGRDTHKLKLKGWKKIMETEMT